MTIGADALDRLRERHRFDEWGNTRPLDQARFVWKFFFGGQELPGRSALRVDTIGLPGPPLAIQSLWGPDKENAVGGSPVRIDVHETESWVEARERLLGLLAQFQSPLISRRSEGPGDVAFGMPNDRSIVFARANMVVVVLNAGDEIESVEPVAEEIDRLFVSPSDVARSTVRPEIRRAEVAEPPAALAPVPLLLEAEDPLGRHVSFLLSTKAGDFFAREGRVFYTPETEGRQIIEVAAVNENLGVALQELAFDI